MKRKAKVMFILCGIFFIVIGGVFLSMYFTVYDYAHQKVQFTEYWAVVRNGGGKMRAAEEPLYTYGIPLSCNVSDLRVFDFLFNISAQEKTRFWLPIQIFGAFNGPGGCNLCSNWTESLSSSEEQWIISVWDKFGKFTPRNSAIYHVETVLHASCNNSIYSESLGSVRNHILTEKNGSLVNYLYFRESYLTYFPDEGFVFYLASLNQTIFYPQFNSNKSWSFSIRAHWNISFEQKYGDNIQFAGNETICEWSFQKINEDTITVSITIDNTNYHPPVPVYTIVYRSPWIEITLLSIGGVAISGIFIYSTVVEKYLAKQRKHVGALI